MMQYRAFVDQVRRRALLDEEGALDAIGATLKTLAERIGPGEAQDLASRLPPEIGRHLRDVDGGETFGLDTFYERVAERTERETPDATYHARVVVTVLHQAVAAPAMAHLRSVLPERFDHLFAFVGKGDYGPGSATSRDDYWS